MARTSIMTEQHQHSEDTNKQTSKKRNAPRKKTVTTGVWPCKINGCNKQFAREADLKRHQRTTKVHSMPGFACPQCDATFTRTDALRRHQKSRHNGVVIEPPDQELKADGEDGSSSQSQSKSRSSTPSSKSNDRIAVAPAINTPASYPIQNTRPGFSSYYRQHTVTNSGPYIPRPTMVDPQCSQIGLPTSATRLNLTTQWGYPHSWHDDGVQQMSYNQMYYSPHYRPNGEIQPPRPADPTDANQQHHVYIPLTAPQRIVAPSCPQNPIQNPKPPQNNHVNMPMSVPSQPSIPVMNPAIGSSNPTTLTREQVFEITQVAMKAVLEAEAERSQIPASSYPVDDRPCNMNISEKNSNGIHGYNGMPLGRPEPMEHMLTEDGEPMLNPAELLTQESLASPPPS